MLVALFFYSGSVFTVAITTEALYLVMLLKNPFYSEKKGSIICIILSWGWFQSIFYFFNIKLNFGLSIF